MDFNSLPLDIHLSVFGMLEPQTLGSCAAVCKQWNELTEDDDLWRPIYERNIATPAPETNVKQHYACTARFADSFQHSRCDIRTIKYREPVRAVCFLSPKIVASGGDDFRVSIHHFQTDQELYTSEKLVGDVYSLRYEPATRHLFVTCDEGAVYAFRVAEDFCGLDLVRKYEGHTNSVWKSAAVDPMRFMTASHEGTARLYHVDQEESVAQFENPDEGEAFLDLALQDYRAYLPSEEGVLVVDIDGGMKQVQVLPKDQSDGAAQLTAVSVHRQSACAGDAGGNIMLYDLRTASTKLKMDTHEHDWIYYMTMKEHIVVSSDDEGRMFCHDLRTGAQVWTATEHGTGSISFDVDWRHARIATGSNDSTVKIWQFIPLSGTAWEVASFPM